LRKTWPLWAFLTVFVLAVLAVMGPSPMPPPGPLGASVVQPSAERAKVIASTREWLATEARGRAVQFYSITWEGGQSATGPYAADTAFYSGFKGIMLVGYWPFVLTYGGFVDDNPIDGYRFEAHLDGLKTAARKPVPVTESENYAALAAVQPALAASGVGVSYDFAAIADWASVSQDETGTLTAKAKLPPRTPTGQPGELDMRFSGGLVPVRATLVLPAK